MGKLRIGSSDKPETPPESLQEPSILYCEVVKEIVKEVPVEIIREVIIEREVKVPVYIDVPVEIIKQVAVDVVREVIVEKIVEVSVDKTIEKPYPVYIDRIVTRTTVPNYIKFIMFAEAALLCILLISKCI